MKTVEGKVVVLGSQGVGKTSMVVRYIGKMFSHHISPTIGASFFTCKIVVNDIKVKLQVWDTAGQERFRAMAPMYYRNANAALLVFDITQYHTFTSVKHWVKELQRNVEEPMLLCLIGNKTDLANQRKVAREEAVQYAGTIGGLYYESSALQDQGVEDIFVTAAEQLIKLSEDPNCTTIRVYENSEDLPYAVPREIAAPVDADDTQLALNSTMRSAGSAYPPHFLGPQSGPANSGSVNATATGDVRNPQEMTVFTLLAFYFAMLFLVLLFCCFSYCREQFRGNNYEEERDEDRNRGNHIEMFHLPI